MQLMVAIVADLWWFVVEAFGFRRRTVAAVVLPQDLPLPAPSAPLALGAGPIPAATPTQIERQPILSRAPALPPLELPTETETPAEGLTKKNTIVYVCVPQAMLRSSIGKMADNVIARIPYGSMIMAIEANDAWVRAYYRGRQGWVAADEVAGKAAVVYPNFTVGSPNGPEDENTRRVRAIIGDEFSYGERGLPLAPEEYVFYKLVKRGSAILWPETRPRTAGRWATIFRNDSGQTTESEEPVERSVMEWTDRGGNGRLAYVEAVHADDSIRVSEVGWPDPSVYSERILMKDEWQATEAVFLVFG